MKTLKSLRKDVTNNLQSALELRDKIWDAIKDRTDAELKKDVQFVVVGLTIGGRTIRAVVVAGRQIFDKISPVKHADKAVSWMFPSLKDQEKGVVTTDAYILMFVSGLTVIVPAAALAGAIPGLGGVAAFGACGVVNVFCSVDTFAPLREQTGGATTLLLWMSTAILLGKSGVGLQGALKDTAEGLRRLELIVLYGRRAYHSGAGAARAYSTGKPFAKAAWGFFARRKK